MINLQIHIITTENSKHFFEVEKIISDIYDDASEWKAWQKRGDPVMHIELGKMADMMVIAPLDANTLAKISMVIVFSYFCFSNHKYYKIEM